MKADESPVLDAGIGEMECRYCGATERFELPVLLDGVDGLTEQCERFAEAHRDCKGEA